MAAPASRFGTTTTSVGSDPVRLFDEIFADRVAAVEDHGYTRREAEFLVTAALHSGYFVRRQFAPQRGKTDASFCAKLAATGHAKIRKTFGQTQLYHIASKPFFRLLIQGRQPPPAEA